MDVLYMTTVLYVYPTQLSRCKVVPLQHVLGIPWRQSCVLAKRVGMAHPHKTQRILPNLLNQISPSYMVCHPPLNRADHVYALRNNNDIREPLSRNISFRKTFIPFSMLLWNAVNHNIQNCSSLSTFKRQAQYITHGLDSMGSTHWINKETNIIPHATCNSCNFINGDPVHYFLECPTYQLARTNLLLSVDPIITDIFPDINNLINKKNT